MNPKIEGLQKYIEERNSCKNPDMTQYVLPEDAVVAFLCGWDAAIKYTHQSGLHTNDDPGMIGAYDE